jgi:membrane-associated protein
VRFSGLLAALAALGLAIAIVVGAVEVPDLAGALRDATESLGGWVYLGVAALVFVETTVLLGFVIHGELALMVGGVAAAGGEALLPLLIALTCAAAVTGDLVSFLLGRRLGRPFLERRGARLGMGPARLASVDAFFARHGGKAIFLGRFTGLLRATVPFISGSSGLAVRQILPFSVASAVVWTTTFTLIGYAFADSFARAGDTASRVAAVGILVAIAYFVVRARLTRRPPAPARRAGSGGGPDGSATAGRRAASARRGP